MAGADLTSAAFASILRGDAGLAIGMILFSYSTILLELLRKPLRDVLVRSSCHSSVSGVYVLAAFLGAVGVADIVWTTSDIANAFMAIPNILMVLLLSGMIARETKHYVWDKNLDERTEDEIPIVEK
ncbi:MAG: alanine:cation symporter family protein [Eggerthellaceae bacterium]